MSNFQVNQEITKFFNAYFDSVINAFNLNNSNKVIPEIQFLGNLFSNLSNANLKNIMYPISNVSNTLNMINRHNTNNLNYIKSDIHYIANYFQNDAVQDLYNEIVIALTDDKYIVTKEMIDKQFNFNKHINQFVESTNVDMVVKQIIPSFYNISLIKIFINIYSIYDTNYDEYIVKNKELDKLLELYNNFIQKYDLIGYKIYYNNCYNPINYYTSCCIYTYSRDDKMTYEIYLEFYKVLNSYYNNLNNINKLKNKIDLTNGLVKSELINEPKVSHVKSKAKVSPVKSEAKVDSVKSEAKVDSEKSKAKIIPVKSEAQVTPVKSKPKVTSEKIESDTENLSNKKKKKPIPVALKRMVWNKWIGEELGKSKCLCCKLTEITMLNFSCGHIIAEANGGELKLDNLKPICGSCNSSMNTCNMNDFIKKYGL